jgi:hypothetical protein
LAIASSTSARAHLGDGFAFLRRVPTGVNGIRIGIADPWFWDGCENGIGEIVLSAIDSLARAGAVVKEKPLRRANSAPVVAKIAKPTGLETGERSGGIRRNLFGGSRRKIAKKNS